MPTAAPSLPRALLQTSVTRARIRCGFLLVAVLFTLGLPLSSRAQAIPPADEPLPRSPLEVLLEQRSSLGLTAAQLGRLDRIRERLATQNDPLVSRMMTLREQWQQERRATRRGGRAQNSARIERIRAAAEQVRTRIQNNNRTAMQTVNQILTSAQRRRLRTIVQERRQNPGRRAGGGSNADDGH